MSRPAPILLVESDRELGEAIVQQLASDGYRVELARASQHARQLASEARPRLAVLGGLDEPRGALGLLEEIREGAGSRAGWDAGLLALVIGPMTELDALRAFDTGADDYIAAPVGYLELRARVRALLRRGQAEASPSPLIDVGALRVDTVRRTATLGGRELGLRRMEYELLAHLATEPSRVFTREELLRAIWGYRTAGETRTVDTHACRLRSALGADSTPWVIGVRGVGYRLT